MYSVSWTYMTFFCENIKNNVVKTARKNLTMGMTNLIFRLYI